MSQLDFVRVDKDPERIAELAIFAEGIFREYFSTLHEPQKVDYLVNHTLSLETLQQKYLQAEAPDDIIFYGYLYQQKKCFGLDYNDLLKFTLM